MIRRKPRKGRGLADTQTHAQFQTAVTRLAHDAGWGVMHVRTAKGYRRGDPDAHQTPTSIKGWPDLFMWYPGPDGTHLAAELKVPPDTLTTEQDDLHMDLRASGLPTYVWRPEDWDDIEEILLAPRRAAWGRTL